MSAAEDFDPLDFAAPAAREKPEQWYRDNAAVFHALEEWQRRWDDHAVRYEAEHGGPPSSLNRARNLDAFRRMLVGKYGRRDPDPSWLEERAAYLELRARNAQKAK